MRVNDLIERLRSVKWEVTDDCGRMPDDPTHKCVFVDMRPDDFRALLHEAAAVLDAARAEVERLTLERDRLQQQYDERTACMIVHRGQALACSDAVRTAYSDECCRADNLRAEVERLAEALALLPDEHDMIEHNPDEGPRMFCCWGEMKFRGLHDVLITHDKDCWYARMRALREQKEMSND